MRTPLVAGNWKMNGTRGSVAALVSGLIKAEPYDCEVMVCPPFVFLGQVHGMIAETSIGLGAQNIDWHEQGAFTGEISAAMVAEAGCRYTLVGHSERRSLFGESNEVVADKFMAAADAGLKPVLCIGETLEQRQGGETGDVITAQLGAVVDRCGVAALAEAVIAYEPVWAIGSGKSATPEQAQEVHREIRETLRRQDANIAENIRILYGGSVKADNATALFSEDDIDGALVGGASLKAEEFVAICRAAE